MRPLIIFGTGSMARVMYSFIRKERAVRVFAAPPAASKAVRSVCDIIVRPWADVHLQDTHDVIFAVGYHEMNKLRRDAFVDALKTWNVIGFIHRPSFVMHRHVNIDSTAVIYDNVAIHTGTFVRENAFISSNVSIGHDCDVGAHAWVNSGVTLAGGVKIGERCVFGIGACVAQGVTLGEGTFVGANTLVTQDTKAGAVVVSEAGKLLPIDSERFIKIVGQP
jgi:carbonic anhydrase/acetyltransferase-like protein (isoleucine patch superfamily)